MPVSLPFAIIVSFNISLPVELSSEGLALLFVSELNEGPVVFDNNVIVGPLDMVESDGTEIGANDYLISPSCTSSWLATVDVGMVGPVDELSNIVGLGVIDVGNETISLLAEGNAVGGVVILVELAGATNGVNVGDTISIPVIPFMGDKVV